MKKILLILPLSFAFASVLGEEQIKTEIQETAPAFNCDAFLSQVSPSDINDLKIQAAAILNDESATQEEKDKASQTLKCILGYNLAQLREDAKATSLVFKLEEVKSSTEEQNNQAK